MPTKSNIYYTEYVGNKTNLVPVILLHGAGSNHMCWPLEIRRINGFHVMALDLPGHGNSKGFGFHAIRNYSTAIYEFLAATGYNRAFFIGHSMGAAIALQFALDHPENTVGLGIISGAASFQLRNDFIELFRSQTTYPLALKTLMPLIAPQKGKQGWFKSYHQAASSTRNSLWYADWRACTLFDIRDRLVEIKTPTFVASGTKDKLVSFSSSSFLANQLINAVIMPCYNNGHMLMLEEPTIISQELNRFLTQNN
jgi:pimeloyl-ACP methyl ester carboxylesterase